MFKEVADATVRAAPPAAVATMPIFGYGVAEWVQVATLIYIVLQAFFLLRDKWWRQRAKRKK